MATFKADRETGVTVHTWDGLSIRIDAGQEYTTDNPREIEVLQGAGGVDEVKPKRGRKKSDGASAVVGGAEDAHQEDE